MFGRSMLLAATNSISTGSGGYDTDAQNFINAVEAADGAALESAVKDAYNTFFLGCKTDSIYTLLRQVLILAGARTLAGALVPMVGGAPTNNNFISSDYDRKTGLKGRSNTWLTVAINNNASPLLSKHMSVWVSSTSPSTANLIIDQGYGTNGGSALAEDVGGVPYGGLNFSGGWSSFGSPKPSANTFFGISRSTSTQINIRRNGSTTQISQSAAAAAANRPTTYLFRDADGFYPYTGRLAFVSLGDFLDMALLNARVATLLSDLAAAIP